MSRRTAPVAQDAAAPAPTDEAAPAGLGFERWLGLLTSFVAPLTLVTTLLFYFGYVSSREYFRSFGIDVDILGFSSQQFVMRSPGALFVPVTALLLATAALLIGHRMLRVALLRSTSGARRRVVAAFAGAGVALTGGGLVFAVLLPALDDGGPWPLVAPLALAAGAGLAAYAVSTARVLAGRRDGRAVAVLLVLVMVAATFWTTATVAQWWGRGEARTLAADLRSLPAVVLDSQERLYPGNDAIGFQDLAPTTPPAGAEEPSVPAETTHRYRYSGLRLLVRGDGALYLVPDVWSPDASTLVIPDDQDVRIRYRFLPDVAG
ncbi:hypothetical protein CVS47_01509 [Microbacterium lemovicicum]|uniref:Uncharacterized protein n=1 Tax=Microbacterium lemovicicum TaxID=1072463 RepID=A0A3Q9IY48_9MICO|nr:hypothetical protein [Microbacterium lemovicicum]AZS36889.1 hypothetical protein CVS47_01509 [Microbacterium lemovicicum]